MKRIDVITDREVKNDTIAHNALESELLNEEREKVDAIQGHFEQILRILGLDLEDSNLKDTPKRVARMYVREFCHGLNPSRKPKISLFENKYRYGQMLIEKNIRFHSICEHHFLPIIGKAHVAYMPKDKIIGLSKINRIVRYCAAKPQIQERLTVQILNEMIVSLETEDVAVWLDAVHSCVAFRGVQDHESSTITSEYSGRFLHSEIRGEFLQSIHSACGK